MRSSGLETILGIEAAVGGGSLAIIRGDEILGEFCGGGPATRSELLLKQIDRFLVETVGSLRAIDHIIASNGPGSYTGVRIGIATATGLAQARGIKLSGAELLTSMAHIAVEEGVVGAMVPMGKNDICFQSIRNGLAVTSPQTLSVTAIPELVTQHSLQAIVAPTLLIRNHLSGLQSLPRLVDAGNCLARHIAKWAYIADQVLDIHPIYVPNPRFSS